MAKLPIFLGAALTTAALALGTGAILATTTRVGLTCNVLLNLFTIPARWAGWERRSRAKLPTVVAAVTGWRIRHCA